MIFLFLPIESAKSLTGKDPLLPRHNLRIACAKTPYLVGKWKEIGKTATLEFWKDGTFKAVDNQGMAVNCLDSILSII